MKIVHNILASRLKQVEIFSVYRIDILYRNENTSIEPNFYTVLRILMWIGFHELKAIIENII